VKVTDIQRELFDREAIRDCLYRYCQGIDRCDADLLRSVYWPDATDDHGIYSGNAYAFVDAVIPYVRRYTQTHHILGNVLMRITGSTASCESYFVGYHRVPQRDGGSTDEQFGGRYIDRLEKRFDEWRILQREVMFDWFRLAPSMSDWKGGFLGCASKMGSRSPDDPVNRLFPSGTLGCLLPDSGEKAGDG